MRFILINDFFSEDLAGGGHAGGAALNDEIVIDIFTQKGENVSKIKSSALSEEFLEKEKDSFFIISNFFQIAPDLLEKIKELNYLIYAHDYKFVAHMNPAVYDNFLIPKEQLIFVDFFKKAKSIICQTNFQKLIYDKNLESDNTVNFSGNLWDKESLDLMRRKSQKKNRKDIFSVVKSMYDQKGVPEAIKFCIHNRLDYELIFDKNHNNFLSKLSANKGLVFWPKTPETCGRMILEAKMMNCVVFTNDLLGASHEPWYSHDGEELISVMESKHDEIHELIKNIAKN